MIAPPRLEAEQLARSAGRRARAAAELARLSRAASPFVVVVNVLCVAATFWFVAVNTSFPTRGLVGAVAGGALSLAAMAYGEVRRLQRRVEALEILAGDVQGGSHGSATD